MSLSSMTNVAPANVPTHAQWTKVNATVILSDELEKIVRFPSFYDRGRSITATFCPITPLEKVQYNTVLCNSRFLCDRHSRVYESRLSFSACALSGVLTPRCP